MSETAGNALAWCFCLSVVLWGLLSLAGSLVP